MHDLLALLMIPAALLAGAFVFRAVELHQLRQEQESFTLQFPRELPSTAVVTFVSGLSGLRPPWYWQWLRIPFVIFEVEATAAGVIHRLTIPRRLHGVVCSHLRAALPGVRLEAAGPAARRSGTSGTELSLSTSRRPLRVDNLPAASSALLASLQPLQQNEQLLIQWVVNPAPHQRAARLAKAKERSQLPNLGTVGDYDLLPHAEALKALKDKQRHPLFRAVGRVQVVTAKRPRAKYLTNQLIGAWRLLDAPGVELRRRVIIRPGWASRRAARASVPLLYWPAVLNAAELVGLLGLPVELSQASGLDLGASRQLAPSSQIPSEGCVVGRSTFPGSERPVAISPTDRLLHLQVVGPTGVGKSVLLSSLIEQDMQAGRSVIVIEPKDLVADVLQRIPKHRVKDVVLLDPADDDGPVVGFNLLATQHAPAELVVEQVVHVFHSMFSGFWGPRTDDLMRASLLTLMRDPSMTLVELPLLLTNPAFRRRFVAQVSDDVVGLGAFWASYEAMSPAERAQVIAPLMNKLRSTLLRSRVRHCIGQSNPGLQLEAALQRPSIILVPLRKGVLGDEAATLLGSLLAARIWQAVQARAALPESERLPVHLYIDEVQDYLRLPTSVGDMLAQARGLKLGVTLAHQHLGQLSTEIRADLLANCRSKIVFQTNAKDARAFEAEFRPHVTTDDLQGLDRFEAVALLAAGQRVAPPTTIRTLPPSTPSGNAEAAIAWSRSHYGRARADIDAEMRQRQIVKPDAPVGRRPLGGTA